MKIAFVLMFFCVGIYLAGNGSTQGSRSIASKTRDVFANRRLANFSPCVYNFNCASNFCENKQCAKRPYDLPQGMVGDACYGDHQNCLSEFCYSGFCLGSDKLKASVGQLCIANSECESNYCFQYKCR